MPEDFSAYNNYNVIDVDGNVLEENVTHEASLELMNNIADSGFTYYYYPLDEAVLAELLEKNRTDNAIQIRFLKPIPKA